MQSILDTLKTDYPAVVEEVKKALGIGEIQKVLQGLLAERVSVRNMVAILETLADYGDCHEGHRVPHREGAPGPRTADLPAVLRRKEGPAGADHRAVTGKEDHRLPPGDKPRASCRGWIPALHRKWITALSNAVKAVQEQGFHEVILCSEAARPLVKSGTAREIPHLAVISSLEVASDITVESLGEIHIEWIARSSPGHAILHHTGPVEP